MTRLVRNMQYQYIDGPCYVWTLGNKNQTYEFFKTIKIFLLWKKNISCDRKSISCNKNYSLIHRKILLWHKVLFFYSCHINILSFTGKKSFCDRYFTLFIYLLFISIRYIQLAKAISLVSRLPDIVQKSLCTPDGAMDPTFQMNYAPAF